ncbi:MAG: hypothetical protein ACFFDH_08510 [Promethearchaeota archaeon]
MQTSEFTDSSDPLFTEPFVDIDEWRDEPIRHRYIHGGFKGTDALFSIYFPPKEQYDGRFIQYIMAISGNENAAQSPEYPDPSYDLGFVFESGAYLVESNLGRKDMYPGDDPTIVGWRTSMAVAKYSRVLASEMYGPHRAYGYAYGGSGGAYKTIACIENTVGVWDGIVPFIPPCPMAMLNVFSVQSHAVRILKDKIPDIIDAVEPGGSGDMYTGLNDEEKAALIEVTKMGFPPRIWFNYQRIMLGYTGVLGSLIDKQLKWDPSYFEDFWKVSGYLGADSPESLLHARIHHETVISKVLMAEDMRKMGFPLSMSAGQVGNVTVPAAFKIESLPEGDPQGASMIFKSGQADGCVAYIVAVFEDIVMMAYGEENYRGLATVKVGDKIEIDNSVYLAYQTYHRHQVPTPDYYVWDQFRDADGKPMYPQRPEILAPRFNRWGQGSVQSGKFEGKMIMVSNLLDEAAFPWQADWYRSKVKVALGDQIDDNYRLWYVDHAMHVPPVPSPFETPPVITTRLINYGGILQQALRDLSAWVEKGVAPPMSTKYKVVDGQVIVPSTAEERKGVQPVIDLKVNRGVRADVVVGEKVKFSANIEAPPNAGFIVHAEWDFEGNGDYPISEKFKNAKKDHVKVKTTYTFSKPGTYFPVLRASLHRQGDSETKWALIPNLGRVRVVVTGEEKGGPEGKELILELKEKPTNFQKIINKFFDTIGQYTTEVQGREISTNEIGPRNECSTKFEVVPSAGETYYTISFEDTESGIGVFVEIDITVSGAYKMMAKMIKKMTSKSIKENAIETLNKILKENE